MTERQYGMALTTTFPCTKGELHQINMCRIFLRIISVSDTTDLDGTHIKQTSYDGFRDDAHSTIRWSNQQRPTKGFWGIWQRFLLSISDSNRYLLLTLHKWLDVSTWHHDDWFSATNNRTLIHKVGNQWFAHN
jgi:hypothetical protein